MRIWVIVITERQNGVPRKIVSHGITEDGLNVVLPQVRLEEFPCKFDTEAQEYYLEPL